MMRLIEIDKGLAQRYISEFARFNRQIMLHTFCENAIKHGFRHKVGVGSLKIVVCQKGNRLVLSVEDDGIGRKKAKEKNTAGMGEGLAIIDQQIGFFNKQNKKKGVFTDCRPYG